ncbi:protein DYAD-like [Neltuma alba]|uniref:protein DYAD n=1 Tax=Neltuma alba TaxID=207710 RepID=UPI0010A56AA6|nr:protein DYAD-like [Prosopis alba]XP_028766133.1 protein DYAD-like [Prosopis alba]XP_028785140.1 protein DYAD-like [Prosopis alba]
MDNCCHQVTFIGQPEENGSQLFSEIPKELKDADEQTIKTETLFIPVFKKRKRLSLSQLREIKAGLGEKQTQTSSKLKTKKHESRDRWSSERYKLAEQSMWEVLKAKGATFANPISRPALRTAARKHIGDTGLLDHLLKHIDGKVAPGGTERFRRWFNTKGIMEYWLESANLDKVRQDAGVQDPYWIPPSTFKAGSPPQISDSSGELKLLQTEMAKMKKDMQELIIKNREKNESHMMEETHKELVKWKAMTEQRLTGILTSLKGVQGMYGDLVIWKGKVEQQLVEITNKLSDLKASREGTTNPPLERWEDWLESTNLENIQGDDELIPWFGSTELINLEQGVALQDPNSALPSQLLNDNVTNMKSELLEMLPNIQEEDQPNVTPDSSITVNSKSDLDNSVMLFQEMLTDLFKWKDKMEKQMAELSNHVYGMLATK